MKRSSIFSFNTLRPAPWPTLPAVLAFILLFIVSALLNSYTSFFAPLANGEKERINAAAVLKYEVEQHQPRVLIVGSSRMNHLPLDPIAKALNIDQSDVVNYSLPGSTYWDSWIFLKDQPEILQDCEYFVMDLVPFRLLGLDSLLEDNPIVLNHLEIRQIPMLSTSRSQAKALFNEFVPVYSHQCPLADWVKAADLIGATPDMRREQFKKYGTIQNANPPAPIVDSANVMFVEAVINFQFPDTEVHPLLADAFLKILDMVPEDATVLLVMPPYRSDVASRIESIPNYRDSRLRFRRWIEDNVSDSVVVQFKDSFPDGLIADASYTGDGSHLAPPGLLVLSRRIGMTLADL